MTSRQGWPRHSGYAETPCCGQVISAATISHVTLDVFSPTSTTRVYPLPKTAGVALGSGKPNLNVGPFNIFKALALTDADLRALRGVASRRLFGRRDYSVCRFTCAVAELMPHPRRAVARRRLSPCKNKNSFSTIARAEAVFAPLSHHQLRTTDHPVGQAQDRHE